MMRYLLCSLFLLPLALVRAQDDKPDPSKGKAPAVEADPIPDSNVHLVREPGGHAALPQYLLFTPDSKKLVSVGDDRTLQVWDVATKERLRVLRLPLGVKGQGWIPDWVPGSPLVVDRQGQRVAFCNQVKAEKGKYVHGTLVCSLETGQSWSLKEVGPRDFSADGKFLAMGQGHDVRLIEIATDTPRATATVLSAKDNHTVSNLTFSPDGTRLAVVALNARIYLLDAGTLKRLHTWTVFPSDMPKEPVGELPVGADGKPLNLDFETGTLKDWTVEGDAFKDQPTKAGNDNFKQQGQYYIKGYGRLGDKPQGTLTSVPFKITQPWASFLISGGPWPETRVELVLKDTKEQVFLRASGLQENRLRRVEVDLRPYAGKEMFIRLVDKHSGSWGYINFDDFRFHDKKPNFPARPTKPGQEQLLNVTWADNQTLVCHTTSPRKALVVVNADTGELKKTYPAEELLQQLPKGPSAGGIVEVQAISGTTKAFVRIRVLANGWVDGGYLLDWASGKANKAYLVTTPAVVPATAIAPDLSVAAQGDGRLNDIILWDPRGGNDRTLWNYGAGYFEKGSDKQWTEKKGNESYHFVEIRRGETEVDLYDKERDYTIRLFENRCVINRPKQKDFVPLYNGRWDYSGRLRAAVRGAHRATIRWRPDGKAVAWEKIGDGADKGHAELDLTTLTFRTLKEEEFKTYRGIRLVKWGALSLKQKNDDTFEILGGEKTVTIQVPYGFPFSACSFVAGGRASVMTWASNVFQVFDSTTGKRLYATRVVDSQIHGRYLSPGPEYRYVLFGSVDQTLTIFNPTTNKILLTIFPTGKDWIAWTPEGYYAATPGGERLMGWHFENGPDKLASFYPADRFRKTLYRPDVIKLVLARGSVAEALKEANAALPKERRPASDALADVCKLLPPKVNLSLVEQDNKGVVKLRTTIEAGPKASPVLALHLLVDGRTVPGEKHNKSFKADKQPTTPIDWPELELPAGEHQVVVLVEGAASTASNVLTLSSRPATDKPVLHVLAIGVDKYQDSELNLRCAAEDASALARAFQSCKGALFGDVRPTVLVNDKATRANILKALKELRTDPRKRVRGNDLVVLFFAGHGVKDREQFYLLTHETDLKDLSGTALSGTTLRQELKDLPGRVLFLMDACQSAGFGEKGVFLKKQLRPATDEATRTLTDDEVGVVVMCAAMGDEEALEVGDHGLFTRFLIEALKANQGVPFNVVNRRQYVHHLWSHVADHVVIESRDRQHPFLHLPWIVKTFPVRQLPETSSGSR